MADESPSVLRVADDFVRTTANGIVNGFGWLATFGQVNDSMDRIAAAGDTLIDKTVTTFGGEPVYGSSFKDRLAYEKAATAKAESESPIAAMAGTVTGNVMSFFVGGGAIAKGVQYLAKGASLVKGALFAEKTVVAAEKAAPLMTDTSQLSWRMVQANAGEAAGAASRAAPLTTEQIAALSRIKDPVAYAHELTQLGIEKELATSLLLKKFPEASTIQLPLGIKIPLNKWTIGLGIGGIGTWLASGHMQDIAANFGFAWFAKGEADLNKINADRNTVKGVPMPSTQELAPAIPVPSKSTDTPVAPAAPARNGRHGSWKDGALEVPQQTTLASLDSRDGLPPRNSLRLVEGTTQKANDTAAAQGVKVKPPLAPSISI